MLLFCFRTNNYKSLNCARSKKYEKKHFQSMKAQTHTSTFKLSRMIFTCKTQPIRHKKRKWKTEEKVAHGWIWPLDWRYNEIVVICTAYSLKGLLRTVFLRLEIKLNLQNWSWSNHNFIFHLIWTMMDWFNLFTCSITLNGIFKYKKSNCVCVP